jgi:predicted anti-sigma-YlaC factor YlaD
MLDFDKFLTDEMLAAYIDNNATPIEKNIIEEHLQREELQEMLDIVSDLNAFPELLLFDDQIKTEVSDKINNQVEDSLQELQKQIEDTDIQVM